MGGLVGYAAACAGLQGAAPDEDAVEGGTSKTERSHTAAVVAVVVPLVNE